MANHRMAEQVDLRYTQASPALLGYSRLSFVRRTNSYGFPRGKAQSFFYPESSLRRSSTCDHNSTSNILDKMPKQPTKVPSLELSSSNFKDTNKDASPLSSDTLSPLTPSSSKSTPNSPFAKGSTIRSVTGRAFVSEKTFLPPHSPNRSATTDGSDTPITPTLTAIPPYPPSPKDSKHSRDVSRSFFGNLKASKSSHRIQGSESSTGFASDKPPKSRGSSKDRIMYNSKAQGSTADLPHSSGGPPDSRNGEGSDSQTQQNQSSGTNKSGQDTDQLHPPLVNKKSKPRFVDMLTRTRSIRVDEGPATAKYPKPSRRPSNGLLKLEELSNQEAQAQTQQPLKTAPLQTDRAFKEAMGSTTRNRSADRPSTSTNDDNNNAIKKERSYGPTSQTSRDGYGGSLFNNLKQQSTGAADRIGKAGMKAGKGIFGKITRSGSSNEREAVADDVYTCTVINLPLIEQTRKTRISKGLDRSKDKTEYWMPALPWRCIDYLNFKGCEEEGLYRVPGSGKEVKHWQRRFDTELDIDLFEENELYDINIIGSMFKAWLRELPDEIFPKSTQAMIADKCAGATEVPQLLKDELSKLPPHNYYLLFAITCHLSLLHSYVDKNKMDYRNLCICFQPCMKIDAFCFHFLVCEWKHCWQGCWTEKEYLKTELEAAKAAEKAKNEPKRDGKGRKASSSLSRSNADERAISSSGSSQPPRTAGSASGAASGANGSGDDTKSSSRTNSPSRGRRPAPKRLDSSHMRSASQLPELGPPLSPIKI